MRDGALAGGLAAAALGLAVLCPGPAPACDVCQLQLRHRTGPYAMTLVKESRSTRPARLRITIANRGSDTVPAGGDGRAARLVINVLGPDYRAIEPVDAYAAPERPAVVRPRSSSTFDIKLRQWFDKPGVYRLNASLGNVDSNILTYTIK
jgi:hypothetical protein